MSVTDSFEFIDQCFITEKDNEGRTDGNKPNIGIVTKNRNGEQKWEFYVNLNSTGHISYLVIEYQNEFDYMNKKLKFVNELSYNNIFLEERIGLSQLIWLNSLDNESVLGSQVDLLDGYFNKNTLKDTSKTKD